jgi:hypothetical protein
MGSLDVVPSGLLDAVGVLRSAADASRFASNPGPGIGPPLASVYRSLVQRLGRVGIADELAALAIVVESAAASYAQTEAGVVRRVSGHGD